MVEKEVEKGRIRAADTTFVSVSAFPSDQWIEWDKECKEKYGDCRWIKMWSDHVRARDLDKIDKLADRIDAIEAYLAEKDKSGKEEPEKKEQKTVKTFGGEVKVEE